MPPPPLLRQTTYAELLERCAAAAFVHTFPEADGNFVVKTVRGRRYWYFQTQSSDGRVQRYVGPETAELLERIAAHREVLIDDRERRSLVSTLVRSLGLSRSPAGIGDIVATLADAGVFRLRGVLVGTVAFLTYPAMLGARLPALQTGDVDIAQFGNVSVALEDSTPPMIDVLRKVDHTFRPVPKLGKKAGAHSYQGRGGLRVDFLTPNQGPEADAPRSLSAFGTDAQPLRFLDYLIHDPEPAVLLHGAGVYVLVPQPERFAVHKLIISRRRRVGAAKRDKDVAQAQALFKVLADQRPAELKGAWEEAMERGPEWRRLLGEGLDQLSPSVRERVSGIVGDSEPVASVAEARPKSRAAAKRRGA